MLTAKLRAVLHWSFWLVLVFGLVGAALPAATAAQAAVVNDDFDSPLIVSSIPYTNTQDIIDATTAADDPGFPCWYNSQKYNTVWYQFTPTTSETLIFSTSGSSQTMLLGVWTGARGSLVNQGCSSNDQFQLAVNAGTVYAIEIARLADSIYPAPTSIDLVLGIWPASTPPGAFSKTAPEDGAQNRPARLDLVWGASTYADSYEYCYDLIDNDACDDVWKPTNNTSVTLYGLSLNSVYYWQVRAVSLSAQVTYADEGAWASFKTVNPADLNHWAGMVSGSTRPVSFDALTDGSQWMNFSVSVPYDGCTKSGNSTILTSGPGLISGRAFSFGSPGDSLRFSGTFGTTTSASGTYTLNNYPVCVWINPPGYCCYAMTSGSGLWTAGGPPLWQMQQLYLPSILK
jgi:hypothetical protein